MFKFIKIISIFAIFTSFAVSANAQTISQVTSEANLSQKNSTADETRIKQLENQLKLMQEQIDGLKKIVEQASINNTIPKTAKNEEIAQTNLKPATIAEKNESKAVTTQQKEIVIDIGSARLTPYGTIYFNAFGNSSGTNNIDVPLFATTTGTSNMSSSVRQTRLGFRLAGAKVGKARLNAVIEADFFGGLPSVAIGENFGVVRLRLANARLDWEKTSLTVGQDWMPFAPVNPTSLAAAAIPQMAAGGNIWARIPQIKLERKLNRNFTWTGAVLAPQTGDSATNAAFFLQPTSGANSNTPFIQSRLAFAETNFFGTKKPGSIGLSGHYGHSTVFTGTTGNIKNEIDSLGVALDWNLPLHERVNLSGEAFWGRNLGGFQAGIFQGYNNDFAFRNGTTLTAGGVRSIGTGGGWLQIGYTPNIWQNRLGIYSSVGIDDPQNKDLTTLSRRDFRSRNFVYAFDVIYKFTPQFSIGGEFRGFQTSYLFTGNRHAKHYNLAAAYSF